MSEWSIIEGDAFDVMGDDAAIAPDSVQCVVTSPPYYGLRDYGVDGQLGSEKTVDEYVGKLVAIFRRVRSRLRPDGVLWLNIGDTYSRGHRSRGVNDASGSPNQNQSGAFSAPRRDTGLLGKNLIGVPWRIALALQADGWILRCDVIWFKPNGSPEPVKDRPTIMHEYLFLLTKSQHYYFDEKPLLQRYSPATLQASLEYGGADTKDYAASGSQSPSDMKRRILKSIAAGGGANIPSVWAIYTVPATVDHPATFPEELVDLCVRSASRPTDLVVDPFVGSGTSALVARRLGRRFIGIELKPKYANLARQRLAPKDDHDDHKEVSRLSANPRREARKQAALSGVREAPRGGATPLLG